MSAHSSLSTSSRTTSAGALFAFPAPVAATRCGPTGRTSQDIPFLVQHELQPLLAQRPHLELHLRWIEQRNDAPVTIAGRFAFRGIRLSTGE